MKRWYFCLAIIFIASVLPSFAKNPNGFADQAIKKQQDAAEKISEQLQDALLRFQNSTSGAADEFMTIHTADTKNAFPVCYTDDYLAMSYRANGTYSCLADSSALTWIIPLDFSGAQGEASAEWKDSHWEITMVSRFANPQRKVFRYEQVKEIVDSSELIKEEISDIHIIRSKTYNVTLVVLSGKESEYIIPLDGMLEEAGIDNKCVYTAPNFTEKLESTFDEEGTIRFLKEAEKRGESYNGGIGVMTAETIASLTQKNNTRAGLIIGISMLSAVFIVCWILIAKKRTKTA